VIDRLAQRHDPRVTEILLSGYESLRRRNRGSSAFRFSMMPVYSNSAMGNMAAPKNPWRRMPMALSETVSRTRFKNGWANASTGSVNCPVHGECGTGDHRRTIEVADARLKRDRHPGHLVRCHASHHLPHKARRHREPRSRSWPGNPSGPGPASPDRPCRCTSRQCYATVRWMLPLCRFDHHAGSWPPAGSGLCRVTGHRRTAWRPVSGFCSFCFSSPTRAASPAQKHGAAH